MKALTQKGYDVNYSWGMNNHGQKFGGAILPDMMRWLWRDGPVSTDPKDAVERGFYASPPRGRHPPGQRLVPCSRPLVPEDLGRDGGGGPARRRPDPGAGGRARRAARRLRRHLQLPAPRRPADSGGPAARQRSRHPPVPGRSRHRSDDARRRPRDGHQPELPGLERRRDPALFRQRDRSGGRRQGRHRQPPSPSIGRTVG